LQHPRHIPFPEALATCAGPFSRRGTYSSPQVTLVSIEVEVTCCALLLYVQVLVVNSCALASSHLHLPLCWFGHGAVQDIGKTGRKSESLLYYSKVSPPTVWYQSRASDDNVWVHDRAPGAPRATTQASNPNASLSNKLMVTNLHYEITPKDLTVCPDPLLSSFSSFNIRTTWRQFLGKLARSCASHSSGYESPTTITSRCSRRRKALNLLAPPFPDYVMLTRLRFPPFFTLSFCTCFWTLV
jgi:hypothetical protein